jgi:hypothetical protein
LRGTGKNGRLLDLIKTNAIINFEKISAAAGKVKEGKEELIVALFFLSFDHPTRTSRNPPKSARKDAETQSCRKGIFVFLCAAFATLRECF